jgi:hypothetical protein
MQDRGLLDEIYNKMLDQAVDLDASTVGAILGKPTTGQRMVFVLMNVDYEVENGGFYQLFWNPSGAFVEEAEADAARVGATSYVRILRAAASVFPHAKVPQSQLTRQRMIGCPGYCTSYPKLEKVDRRWQPRSFAKQLRAYIARHPQEFFK